jgi:TfoX/Sxy family transcriptional regulator of competence genes
LATSLAFKEYMEDRLKYSEGITFKRMFGEYGLFYHDKMVGVLADNQLFIKPTEKGRELLGEVILQKFYEQGKPYFLIEDIDAHEDIINLIKITYADLPEAKPKKVKNKKI